jgi:hypothetical protein
MKKRLRSNKGQMTIEAVLLMTIMVAFFATTRKIISGQNYMSKLVSGPWSHVAGMIENGVWKPALTSKQLHPNVFDRRASPEPL